MLKKERKISLEIDVHFKLYGKEPWKVDYDEKCPICNVRIDEYGFVLVVLAQIKSIFHL
jgi:hypothetical protein